MKTNVTPLIYLKAEGNQGFNRLELSWLVAATSLLACFSLGVRAEITAPYAVDEHTLHLWHMNEQVTPVLDAIPSGIELRSLENGATLGNESFVGAKNFGTALGTYVGNPSVAPGCVGQNACLAALPLQNGKEDNVPIRYAGDTEAFTYEAIVRVDFHPTANFGVDGWGQGRNLFMQIISGDADENADRVFQFRIAPIGTLNGNTQPLLEFINLNKGSNVQSLTAAIPTSGAEAIRAGNWYHVAVSYDGQPDRKDNLRFYWSLIQAKRTTANLIGTGQMTRSLPAGCGPDFAIGQTGRQSPVTPTPNNNFVGLIDEVRISDVARSPQEMLFGESVVAGKQTKGSTDLAAAKTPAPKPETQSASANTAPTTVSTPAPPASATTEAAVDSIRRAAELTTVVNGAIVRGPQSKPRLAILFSCRESDEAAITTLRTLKAQRAKASFFVSSSFLSATPNRHLVESMLADGHYVGPQADTWSQFTKSDRTRNLALLAEVSSHLSQLEALGINRKDIRYFLPTSDQLTPVAAEQTRALGLTMVAGTSGTLSYATATVEGSREFASSQAILDSILKVERADKGLNGYLLLFPLDSGARRTDRFNSRFGELLGALHQRGYEFVRVDELLDDTTTRKAPPSLADLKQP